MKTFKRTVPEPGEWEFSFVPVVLVMVAFVVFHLTVMFIDWNLRDKGTSIQPMPGGIPTDIDNIIIWMTLVCFFIGSFLTLPKKWRWWTKGIGSVALSILMLAALTCMRLYYILNNGIDTL